MRHTRRSFIKSSLAASALGLAGPRIALGAREDDEILVVVFLRGGMDGLSFMPPIDGVDRGLYEAARPSLAIPKTGPSAALELGQGFGLHPSAGPLRELFSDGHLAFVQAAGMNEDTRSHFEAQDFIELGTPGIKSTRTGWLHRHVELMDLPSEVLAPVLSAGGLQPLSLLGSNEVLAVESADWFTFNTGPWLWQDPQRAAMRRLYEAGTSATQLAGLQAMNAVDLIEAYGSGDVPPAGGATYPEDGDGVGDRFRFVARMIKAGIGIRVVTIDVDGWDTHENQGEGIYGDFALMIDGLSRSLMAFYTDLEASGYAGRLTVVGMTEFGRRFEENADGGTDHGHGAPMFLLGGNVNGGLYGQWPGLRRDQLFEEFDLEVTTDYRRVLAEVLRYRTGTTDIDLIFPGYDEESPLGLVRPRSAAGARHGGTGRV